MGYSARAITDAHGRQLTSYGLSLSELKPAKQLPLPDTRHIDLSGGDLKRLGDLLGGPSDGVAAYIIRKTGAIPTDICRYERVNRGCNILFRGRIYIQRGLGITHQ